MVVQIGAKLDSGFEDPLGMLTDCHRRIEHFLGILCNVAERTPSRELNAEEVAAVGAALRYFREGGQRHTADEEDSLFPRLRKAIPSGSLDSIDHLQADHCQASELHAAVERMYERWIGMGTLSNQDRQSLSRDTKLLRHLYTEHIQMEETVVFPLAAQVLDGSDIAAIGTEFSARRK